MINWDINKDIILEDEYVLLRPLKIDDTEHLLGFSVNEPGLWKYSSTSGGGGEEKLKNYIEVACNNRALKTEYPFIVFDKTQNKYAGSTRFYDIQLVNETMQLGFTWYGAAHQGTGLNKHCKYLLLQFAFEVLGMERVEFRADNRNEKSKAAMKSIGCTAEGILRSNMPTVDGGRRDSIVLSILQNEWFENVKENLGGKL
jgi:RimJ/RimL family protein N-acetyltransferase